MKGRKLLMIPGPIEFEPAVLKAMGTPTTSHVAPDFIQSFKNALEMMKEVWMSPGGQPFILAGSGTLAMDTAAVNLIEPGDKALVVSTGYFGRRYRDLIERYGASVTLLEAAPGETVSPDLVEKELKQDDYKILTFTHVDTSTAVKVDPVPLGKLGKKYGVLTILDGVCSVAGEEIRQDEWGIDVVLTASQKAIGVPPGLALLVASQKAIETWRTRKSRVSNYYADWSNWLPIMEAYGEGKPSYFGTPAVNLVQALEISLGMIISEGLENRFSRHQKMADAIRAGLLALGLDQVPEGQVVANTLSAPYFPEAVNGPEFLKRVNQLGVILAPGLLPELKANYFRIGHMGSVNQSDVLACLGAIENALRGGKHHVSDQSSVNAALELLQTN